MQTLHLNLSTVADRHLVAAYVVILVAQFGYAAWVAWNLKRSSTNSDRDR